MTNSDPEHLAEECARLRQDIRELRDELKKLREYVDDQVAEVREEHGE